MKNIRLLLAYKGTFYAGWQKQKNANSIQSELEKALSAIYRNKIRLIGSGRTDSGVHAKGQVANYFTDSTIPVRSIKKALNSLLPHDIRTLQAKEVSADFHSQYSAISKMYRYRILNREIDDVFGQEYTYHYPEKLNLSMMQKAAFDLIGRHDFKAFQRSEKKERSSIRTMFRTRVQKRDSIITIDCESDGFLYNMVRSIAGTLIEIGRGRFPENHIRKILRSKSRKLVGPTAPAKGLCLMTVNYTRRI